MNLKSLVIDIKKCPTTSYGKGKGSYKLIFCVWNTFNRSKLDFVKGSKGVTIRSYDIVESVKSQYYMTRFQQGANAQQ